ncbi:MAG TPA: PIN domain-containing protein [Thermoanaerobaculia bacterium]|jgi:predicted nucleic acid-binding protein|nr:PIN domain-containing protein [Thermoanaerobaculia bacterium]MDI9632174.1 PIN domain-containing protein [Acidobacteriota bacterium]OQC40909.1 MAG: tRNA(fMet)-specific endonuclease VapC [Acidobacteria bacterium ADurb.Bin051]MBP7814376.1 PIN domain-containing protein [Thermoanaerobaculia bacterium]MBP8846158.1 PIN domain-containing protein [Thermoanaerobaculia bacterium]
MSGRAFVDTNVLVYAHDRGAGEKNARARELVARLWRERTGVVSTQVLQELYVNVRRKASAPVSAPEARALVEDYLAWPLVVNDGATILQAVAIEERFGLSFWDALVVASAQEAGVEILWSEDLNDGQAYGSVVVRNPFRD